MNMRRSIRRLRLVAVLALMCSVTASCQDTYEDMFLDPNSSTSAEIEYLFTQALLDSRMRINGGDESYWLVYRDLAHWAQLTGAAGNNADMMQQANQNAWSTKWQQYYTEQVMRVREMRRVYQGLPEAKREQNQIYLVLGKILTAYNTAHVTDLWGMMPYTEAFTARAGERSGRNYFPAYDSQEEVYTALLDSLRQASETLARGSLPVPSSLERQDLFLGGDLRAWQRFADGLRLRHAMRMAEVAPDRAREQVRGVMAGGLLVESNSENILWTAKQEGGGSYQERGTTIRGGTTRSYLYAPEAMLGLMRDSEDPRVPVFFDPSWEGGDYVGLPSSPDEQPADVSRAQFAYVDSLLFGQHTEFPAYIVTAAEVSLLKAEAYLRGWADGDAEAAYDEALRQSVEMYYDLYNANPNAPEPLASPSEEAMNTFLQSEPAAFDNGSFEAGYRDISIQKYIHFNHTWPFQAWATLRRTDYPQLLPDVAGGRTLERTVRATYPSSELANNRESYQEIAGQDTPTTRVWWDVK